MDLGFDGRRVVVVGGSYGIGLAAGRQMAGEGARVLLVARTEENLRKAADTVEAATGRRPDTFVADATEAGAAERVAAEAERLLGGLDVLVSAVGTSIRSAFADLTDDDWLTNYQISVLSAVRNIRAMLPLLKKGGSPAVVMLGAASARMPYMHQAASNVHKAGLLGLTKTLAGEFAADGIRVNCVAPDRTLTRLWTDRADRMAAERNVSRGEILTEFSQEIPLRRFGKPDEVAVMVTWLASPRAAYVTGQTKNVDGGIARGLL